LSNPDFSFTEGNLNDPKLMEELASRYENIVLLAALVGEAACDKDPKLTLLTNYLSPLLLLDACLYYGKTLRFIFISTDSCYGNRPGETLTEDSELKPLTLYAVLKAKLEQMILERTSGTGLSATILRLATVYGLSPRMRFDLAVNLLTREATLKKRAAIYSGEQWRPLVHVSDVASAISLALALEPEKARGEVFNVGSNEQNVKFSDLGRLIRDCVPGSEIEIVPGAPDLRDYYVSFDKISGLGYKPAFSLRDGILEIKSALTSATIPDPYSPIYRNA
jgi:nucleoside-diphosphate-sugar epimerase